MKSVKLAHILNCDAFHHFLMLSSRRIASRKIYMYDMKAIEGVTDILWYEGIMVV